MDQTKQLEKPGKDPDDPIDREPAPAPTPLPVPPDDNPIAPVREPDTPMPATDPQPPEPIRLL